MSPLGELSFKRWKDRRKAHEHIFIAWQSMMLCIAIPMAIHVAIKTLFFS